jgi:hypothetical protein
VNNKPWHVLNIDVSNAVREDFNFEEELAKTHAHKSGQWLWSFHKSELATIFNSEWLEYMKSLNLEVFSMLMFYRAPYLTDSDSHIDLPTNFAINWVHNDSDDSEMQWYDTPLNLDYARESRTAQTGGYVYIPLKTSELDQIDSRCLGKVTTLVRTDIPHSIHVGAAPRWAFSVRVNVGNRVGGSLSWEEAVEILTPFIIS